MPIGRGDRSHAEILALCGEAERDRILTAMAAADLLGMQWSWSFWSRPSQRQPVGDWRIWLIQAGRGFGKTRAGAEWVRWRAERDGQARIALVGATMAEGRAVMVEGESGLLSIAPPNHMPAWEPSLNRLRWPNGAQAFLYSAAEPESLRGPQHHFAWADEIGKWPKGIAVWDNLMMGLRLGSRPRAVATTTPRPVPLVRRLLTEKRVVVTRGRTIGNRPHLPPDFIAAMEETYGGTRFGRQELDGELIDEVAGALWSRALIEERRVMDVPEMVRVVIGVDPPAGAGGGDACGIVAVGLGRDRRAYVLADASVAGVGPEGWARAVAQAAEAHRADRVVAEANNGGAMVESVLRAADERLPLRLVHATRGKVRGPSRWRHSIQAGGLFMSGRFPSWRMSWRGLWRVAVMKGRGDRPTVPMRWSGR